MAMRTILLLLSLWQVHCGETLTRVKLDEVDSLALCNDGTPVTYTWKKSPTGSNKWLIYLKGGGGCWDEQSCKVRSTFDDEPIGQYWSSKTMPKEENVTGIFSTKKSESPLWDANKAYLDYCTSDFYMGQVGGRDNATNQFSLNWKFRGQNSVNAFIKHLVEKQGLGKDNSSKIVVFGGWSTGAVTTMSYLDQVADMLKPYNAKVLGYLDSPLYFDNLEPMYPDKVVGVKQRMKQAFYQFNMDSIIPKDCAESFDKDNQWKCIYPEYRLKYLKTPFLLVADQYDNYWLGLHMDILPKINDKNLTFTQKELKYAAEFGKKTKNFLMDYDFEKNGQQGMIYSRACGPHGSSTYEGFYKFQAMNKMREPDALAEAISDMEQGKVLNKKYIDDCEGVRCNHCVV